MRTQSLTRYLEYQCDRVEAVMAELRLTSRVTGGTAGPVVIRLFVQGGPWVRYRQIHEQRGALAEVLGAPELLVTFGGEEGTAKLIFSTPECFSMPAAYEPTAYPLAKVWRWAE